MEIIITNKKLLTLAKINNAKEINGFSYSGPAKYKFLSLNNCSLVKSVLYVGHDNNYFLEKRR